MAISSCRRVRSITRHKTPISVEKNSDLILHLNFRKVLYLFTDSMKVRVDAYLYSRALNWSAVKNLACTVLEIILALNWVLIWRGTKY